MARRAGGAARVNRYAGALFSTARGLLFAASERRFGRCAQAGGLLRKFRRGRRPRLRRAMPAFKPGEKPIMPKYVIEREIPGAGNLSADDLHGISQKSCSVLQNLGPQIQWVQSYVTDDKVYCVYIAPSEDMIRAHAQEGGFPANKISEIKTVIDPTTAESKESAAAA